MDRVQLARSLESRGKASAATLSLIDREAAVDNDNTLWITIDSHIRGTAYRYTRSDNPVELYEWDMHDIWYEFVLATKNIDADHPAQDRLTRLVVWAKVTDMAAGGNGSGSQGRREKASRKKESMTKWVVQEAMTTDGPIWSNLPFLVQDMRLAWNEAMDPSIPTAHRHNLAAAIARLAGLGVRDDALSGCGLSLMCETLETPRKLTAAASKSEIEQGSPTVVQLLPAVRLWLLYAGHKLLRLSESK